jgi:hypothetical protein
MTRETAVHNNDDGMDNLFFLASLKTRKLINKMKKRMIRLIIHAIIEIG